MGLQSGALMSGNDRHNASVPGGSSCSTWAYKGYCQCINGNVLNKMPMS